METDKATMRRIYRQRRDEYVRGLSNQDRNIAFSQVPTPVSGYLRAGCTVAGYIAKDNEASPQSLLKAAHDRGCVIALPHVISRLAPMRFLRWQPGDALIPGTFGLMQPPADAEPVSPDVVLVPLVAFDSRLMRLGQGAGHYDRALSLLDRATAIGIAWSVQHAPAIEADPWDIPMDAVLTEKSWITI
jgi:5-formyltetrahydrofolate cyclo-ligase